MSFKNKLTVTVMLLATLIQSVAFFAGASYQKANVIDDFYSRDKKLLCISHRGYCENYPENSFEGIKAALEKGADFVSVNLDKTDDGVFYLCERESLGNVCNAPYESLSELDSSEVEQYFLYDVFGRETKYKLTSLARLLENTDSEDGIILDVLSEDKDAVYDILSAHDAVDRVIIRAEESISKLIKWAESKEEKVNVIGVYTGNIIFSTVSAVKSLTNAQMPAVQYESKNYFNVAYGEFFTNRFLNGENVRAVASAYSPDLCGQRGDSSDGWNELIKKGYSVIETNNIEAFLSYRSETEALERKITELMNECAEIENEKYSQVSLSNFTKARVGCDNLLSDAVFSLDEAQKAYSDLLYALKEMKISSGEVDTKGALNITAGKVVAAVLVGAALLAGQIYVYRMRKDKKEKKESK